MTAGSITLQPTFSFYVGPSDVALIAEVAAAADAVTVVGKGGPDAIRTLRRQGFTATVLFDRAGYSANAGTVDIARWIDEQTTAGADRVLTAGRLVSLRAGEPQAWRDDLAAELALAEEFEATALVALDARILARHTTDLIALLGEARRPVALVLADRADPLALSGATDGLSRLVRATDQLSVLRADHGAVAVPAFGGAHAAFGLVASKRHYAMSAARAKRGNFARVFVPYYLDWFTADLIAGWAAAERALRCDLPCCEGRTMDRFLDTRLQPREHNMRAIAAFADYVLTPDPVDRPRTFLDAVATAHSHYDIDGLVGPTSKAQLNAWALG